MTKPEVGIIRKKSDHLLKPDVEEKADPEFDEARYFEREEKRIKKWSA